MPESPTAFIHRFLNEQRQRQVEFLADLVKVPSDNPPGDTDPHSRRAAELLEGLGLEVERHPVPESDCRANGMISATNLVVRHRFGDGPTIALNAHGDVVPPGEGWTTDPYGAKVRSGTMYGRGVAVSKSDFATYTFALLALKSCRAALAGTIELHFTYDEEVGGGIGPKRLLDQGLSKPDFAICAGFSYSVVTAHNGCLHLEVEVMGKSAHAARPDTGHDALEAATAILAALYAERAAYSKIRSEVEGIGSPSLVVGLIQGGINTNVVPDRVRFRLDRRLIPEERPETVGAGLRELVNSAAARFPGISVSIRQVLLARSFRPLPGVELLVEPLTRHASEVFGTPVTTQAIPLYTDARHYAAAGVPTVLYGAGPRTMLEANAHRADERLVLDDLGKATEVVARALTDLLAGDRR
jgi:acetylornithine deacetylase/succinyl-diaminopimelate desuccinylase family protein